LSVVRDVLLRRSRPGQPADDVESPNGRVFGVCRDRLSGGKRAGMTVTRSGNGRGVRSVVVTAKGGGARCTMSDGGAALIAYRVAARTFRGLLVRADGPRRRVALGRYGVPEALSPDGRTLIARQYGGSRRTAVVNLRTGGLHRTRAPSVKPVWSADQRALLARTTGVLHVGTGQTTRLAAPKERTSTLPAR
jgi:hypothetical protein